MTSGIIVQVLSVDHNKNEVELKLVPRVDTTDYSQFEDSEARKRKAKAIPPKRLFDPTAYKYVSPQTCSAVCVTQICTTACAPIDTCSFHIAITYCFGSVIVFELAGNCGICQESYIVSHV